jgi:amino acid transporter
VLVGRAMRSNQLHETELRKRLALPVFCSDPLSSVAYATEEILLVLSLGGLALLHLAWPVALAIVALLVIVVASYRQTVRAYPDGGGAYAVASANLGRNAGLAAASALLVDYVLTVAVSVVAGVAAITSAVPELSEHAVALSVAFILLLTLMNLRGVQESGRAFAAPTYLFLIAIFTMLTVAGLRLLAGDDLQAQSAGFDVVAEHHYAGLALALLAMRAFASGCTALTGVEAVSNGVPSFRAPKPRNAAITLTVMGALSIVMFAGITALALRYDVHVAHDPTELGLPPDAATQTVLAQVADTTFGGGLMFYLVQAGTAGILILAANTAYNGFPMLSSLLARDHFLPHQLSKRGDRLVFSNGIVLLAGFAIAIVMAFDADVSSIIQLYIIGVFVSFTLSQAGMVRHWQREIGHAGPDERVRMRRAQAINGLGAAVTGFVLIIVLVTKFTHGAWIVTIAMPALFLLMLAVRTHYDRVAIEVAPSPVGDTLPARVHAVIPVSTLNEPTLRAVAFARATKPDTLEAVTVDVDPEQTAALMAAWAERDLPISLTVITSPYRELNGPLVAHIRRSPRRSPRDVVCVFIPEYVVRRWWQQLLHNQSALRLKGRLLFTPGVMVCSVPFHLDGGELRSREEAPADHP